MPVSEFQHVGFIQCVGECGKRVLVHEFRAVSVSPIGERRLRPERRYRLENGQEVQRDDPETFRLGATGYRLTVRDAVAT